VEEMSEELQEVGRVTHYFTKIGVAVVELKSLLSVGDHIHFKGPNTDFTQTVKSMQIEHRNITQAKTGQSIGLKVDDRVRENDRVYKII
jgi:translation elongation factor EF-1alpha